MERMDLIRFGSYAQMEGTVYVPDYRFRFRDKQIPSIKDLCIRLGKQPNKNKNIYTVYSRDLFILLRDLGFHEFRAKYWNVPDVFGFNADEKLEYLRAVIDCLGNVDIEQDRVVVRVSSHNLDSITRVVELFEGAVSVRNGRAYAFWKDYHAINLLNDLDWKFYNPRNERGAELITGRKWEEFL